MLLRIFLAAFVILGANYPAYQEWRLGKDLAKVPVTVVPLVNAEKVNDNYLISYQLGDEVVPDRVTEAAYLQAKQTKKVPIQALGIESRAVGHLRVNLYWQVALVANLMFLAVVWLWFWNKRQEILVEDTTEPGKPKEI